MGSSKYYVVEFVNHNNTEILGHLKTRNYKAIDRIANNLKTKYDDREAQALKIINGLTLEQAYEQLHTEFVTK
jgi:hypothetical protein